MGGEGTFLWEVALPPDEGEPRVCALQRPAPQGVCTLALTSSSEQGTQCPLPKCFDVQEGFIPNAHGDHLLHSEL